MNVGLDMGMQLRRPPLSQLKRGGGGFVFCESVNHSYKHTLRSYVL